MNSSAQIEKDFAREQSRAHEQRTNKVVGLVSLGLVAIKIVAHFMLYIDFSEIVYTANKEMFMPISVIVIGTYLAARHYKFDAPWIKYTLIGDVILLTIGEFYVFTYYASYFVIIPIVLSIRYSNKRFISIVCLVTAILFVVACVLNLTMADEWTLLRMMRQKDLFDPWNYPIDAVVFIIIPMSMVSIFIAAYGIEMTKSAGRLLDAHAQAVSKVTTVRTELNMASEIQRGALPDTAFTTPDRNFSVEARIEPAREVGGDFYDYFMVNGHTLAVLIADVSDKGLAAAMFMMSAKKAIRCAVECCHSLKDAVKLANRLICENNDREMFLTMWLCLINTETGVGKYINAGHPFPIIRSESGAMRPLSNDPDLFMGTFPDMEQTVHTFKMNEGDTLLLYTDGITDAMNASGGFFGSEGIMNALEQCGTDAKNAVDEVMKQSHEFAGKQEQFDDMTLLALQCVSLKPILCETIETRADGEGTQRVIERLNELLMSVDCPDDTRRNANVIADELCANISLYAYDSDEGKMRVSVELGSNCMRLVFSDDGKPFDPLQHADPLLDDEPVIGGLGIFFVKNLADSLRYCRNGDSNELTVEMVWDI